MDAETDCQETHTDTVWLIDTGRTGLWSRLPGDVWRVIERCCADGNTVAEGLDRSMASASEERRAYALALVASLLASGLLARCQRE